MCYNHVDGPLSVCARVNLKDIRIPQRWLDVTTTAATLGGIVLGFDAVASAVFAGESPCWGIFGLAVAVVSGFGAWSHLLDFFGDFEKEEDRLKRRVGGGVCLLLFYIFAAILPLFRL